MNRDIGYVSLARGCRRTRRFQTYFPSVAEARSEFRLCGVTIPSGLGVERLPRKLEFVASAPVSQQLAGTMEPRVSGSAVRHQFACAYHSGYGSAQECVRAHVLPRPRVWEGGGHYSHDPPVSQGRPRPAGYSSR